ncbi:MAG TPA: hypothetical protein PLQ95_01210 [Thiobacillus sp.]|nr:hypothetical protein [Thiobacillus sp.]
MTVDVRCIWPAEPGRPPIALTSYAAQQFELTGDSMMKHEKTVGAALVMGALLVALSGCQKQEGPAEKAGKQADQATEKAGEQIEKLGDSIQDTAKGDK